MNRNRTDLAEAVRIDDHILGPDDAPVVVVEYGDFECPNCRQAAPAVKMLLRRFGNRVRFVYRHFPLEEVHPHALQAAEAVEAAGSQGRFWEMHDLLFDHQSHLELVALRGYARDLELDMARFTTEFEEHRHLARIHADVDGGKRSGVRGTPGFFVNGTIQDVSFGLRSLFDTVDAALQRCANEARSESASR